ncbi:MAG: signal recognition particle protein [Chlamydiae bacterium]|nr:signal recognition particle protein [Chlamydiota bacterium]
MLGVVTEKFKDLFASLAGKKTLTEDNLTDAVRDVRLALLEADVNYSVASNFVKRVKEKVLGEKVLSSVTPSQQFTKIVHDELVALMGFEEAVLQLHGSPSVILLCGLQGSGKTTHCAKLAAFLKRKGYNKKPLLAACDLQRPAAIEQLKKLGMQAEVPVFSLDGVTDPVKVAKAALEKARLEGFDVLILDTAGRLHVDESLMEELEKIKAVTEPQEILFVASANTGQDATKIALEFDKRISITGTIITMLDGNARAGAAISIREITGKPLKFEGVGEKLADLQVFHPRSMADRILGMGDIINLVKKAEEHIDEKETQELEKKLRKASFTYEDYLRQMSMLKKMGSFKSIFKMIPGFSELPDLEGSEKELKKIEAMILSMTASEREERVELIPSRRNRVAKGSGTTIDDVNRMVKNFKRLKQFFKDMPAFKQQFMKEGKKKENMTWR